MPQSLGGWSVDYWGVIGQLADVVIGLDLGTGGVRAIAVDLQGQIIAQTTRSYPLLTPQPGWTEQNPSDWVEATLDALSDVAQQLDSHRAMSSDKPLRVYALGLSGQMHGMVPIDVEGRVIRPAILWNDQRTGKAVEEIEATIPRQELIQRTGNPAITGFQLPKLVWYRYLVLVAFYFCPTYQENAVRTSIQIRVVPGLMCHWRIRRQI